MSSTKSKATSPSSHRPARTRAAAAKPVVHRSAASRVSAPAVKRSTKVAAEPTLAQRALAKVKTKAGLAVVAGVVLAGVGGLAYNKYRAAH